MKKQELKKIRRQAIRLQNQTKPRPSMAEAMKRVQQGEPS